MDKAGIAQRFGIIADALPCGVPRGVELAEGQINALNKGPYKADTERHKGGQNE